MLHDASTDGNTKTPDPKPCQYPAPCTNCRPVAYAAGPGAEAHYAAPWYCLAFKALAKASALGQFLQPVDHHEAMKRALREWFW